MIRIRAPRDFAAGCVFLLIALFFLWFGRHLSMGSSSFMEAGYFPRLASLMLAILGLLVVASSMRFDGPDLTPWALRPLLILSGAVVLFGLIIPRAGLVVTTIVVVAASTVAGHRLRRWEVIILSVVLALLMVGLFHYGLSLPIPVWPKW